ncbi:uncharacterized protein LOC118436661 [Folsomia candida]|nr:uncharacterized protein LOC118436661 [Folsomia candida]XP_035711069.1 uncharacterized protein LOC118436661 [Folsomia candida]
MDPFENVNHSNLFPFSTSENDAEIELNPTVHVPEFYDVLLATVRRSDHIQPEPPRFGPVHLERTGPYDLAGPSSESTLTAYSSNFLTLQEDLALPGQDHIDHMELSGVHLSTVTSSLHDYESPIPPPPSSTPVTDMLLSYVTDNNSDPVQIFETFLTCPTEHDSQPAQRVDTLLSSTPPPPPKRPRGRPPNPNKRDPTKIIRKIRAHQMKPTTKRIRQAKAAYERRLRKKEFDKKLLAELAAKNGEIANLKKAAIEQKDLKERNKQLRADLAAKTEENVSLKKTLEQKNFEIADYKNRLWNVQNALFPPIQENYGSSIEATNLDLHNFE